MKKKVPEQKCTESDLFSFFNLLTVCEKRSPLSDTLTWKETYLLQYIAMRIPASITEIADGIQLSLLEASRLVSKLAARQLIEKKDSAADRRAVSIHITERGRTALEHAKLELLNCLNTTHTAQSSENAADAFFKNHYEYSTKLICRFNPLFDIDEEISDLEFLEANQAFIREFPKAVTLTRYTLMSQKLYQHVDIVVSVCNTVWKTRKPVKIRLDIPGDSRIYDCIWFRDSQNALVAAGVPTKNCNPEYLSGHFTHPALTAMNKAVKMVVDCDTGQILAANEQALRFYGWKRELFLKKTIYEISMNPPETTRTKLKSYHSAQPLIFPVSHRRADNSVISVIVHAATALCEKRKIHFATVIPDTPQNETPEPPPEQKHDAGMRFFSEQYQKNTGEKNDLFHFIEDKGKLFTYDPGDYYPGIQASSPTFTFIIEGLFRVYYVSPAGRDYTLEYLRPGTSIDSLTFSGIRFSDELSIEAVTPGKILTIEQQIFCDRAAKDKTAYSFLYGLAKQRITSLMQRNMSLLADDAKDRYERFLNTESDIAGCLTGQGIASYLKMAPETLSRIRKAREAGTPRGETR
jgi:CRP/FNR family transcriptional regulator, anaerobic regulatory protein